MQSATRIVARLYCARKRGHTCWGRIPVCFCYHALSTYSLVYNTVRTLRAESICIYEGVGFSGIEGSNDNGSVCCPVGCGQCGGPGCYSSGVAFGLTNTACCINGVLNSADRCSDTNQAPCIIDGMFLAPKHHRLCSYAISPIMRRISNYRLGFLGTVHPSQCLV